MPDLDVTDILSDPDLSDVFSVIRSAEKVGSDGRATTVEKTIRNVVGVICANDDLRNTIDPEGRRDGGSITIHTTFRLHDGKTGYAPDKVVYDSNTYQVATIGNFSRFGRGFVTAVCDLLPMIPT